MFNITVVGRPNVGKSTLFNVLSGKNIALTAEIAGLTRDRKETLAQFYDIKCLLVDTGGYDTSLDDMSQKIWKQAQLAINSSDCIIFIVDAKAGVSPSDKIIADYLRLSAKPVILCINKIDTKEGRANASLFFELGFANICQVSAEHSIGLMDLYYLIKPYYEKFANSDRNSNINSEKPELSLAFVGKPNVGKSSIINRLLEEERLIVSDIAGTTRDSIYLDLYYNNKKIKVVDTAGLRRRSNVSQAIEKMANSDSIRAINFATVVALIISAEDGLTKQDLIIAKRVVDEGRGLIIIVNKIDLIKNKKTFLNHIVEEIEYNFFQIKQPYVLAISALQDKDILSIMASVLELYEKWQFKIGTSLLNKWLAISIEKNQPPTVKGKRLKIKYASQIKERPATINLWSNFKEEFPESYLRYLRNEFYEAFNLWGSTVRFAIQKSDNPYKDKPRLNKREQQVKKNAIKRRYYRSSSK